MFFCYIYIYDFHCEVQLQLTKLLLLNQEAPTEKSTHERVSSYL